MSHETYRRTDTHIQTHVKMKRSVVTVDARGLESGTCHITKISIKKIHLSFIGQYFFYELLRDTSYFKIETFLTADMRRLNQISIEKFKKLEND